MVVMVSLITLSILVGYVVYFCYVQVQIAKFSRGENEKRYVKILLFGFILANIWFYLNINIAFPIDYILMIGFGIMIAFFWLYHLLIKYVFKSDTIMSDVDNNFQEQKGTLHEFLRKFFHFFTFGGSLLFVFLYHLVSTMVIQEQPDFSAFPTPWMLLLGFDFVIPFVPIVTISILQVAMMMFFMIALPFAMIVERFRLDPGKHVAFHDLFVKSLRQEEQHNAAHYYFFAFGIFLSAVALPAAAVFGILCVLCFGDTFAGLIGKRCKNHRHCIRYEPKKCWEGAFAGFIFTFFTAILFVGWFLALMLSIIFIVIDCITPTKLKVSDNFLYPLVCIAVLTLFYYGLGFPLDGPIGLLFSDMNTFYAEGFPAA